jgi:septal ring factor EnvC (AmiA/AmiB activator)
VSSVPRHSEEELRQQWAFLDALVDRQAASLKSGAQDPEEDDAAVAMVAPDPTYLEEISTLTQRVTTLEGERTALLRRIDLSEEARVAAESARSAAEAARAAAERALAEERSRPRAGSSPPRAPAPLWESAAPASPAAPRQPVERAGAARGAPSPPKVTSLKPRRKSWWQRIRE